MVIITMASIAAIELVEILLEEAALDTVAELGTTTVIDAEVLDAAAVDAAIDVAPMPGYEGPAQLSAGGPTALEQGLADIAWDYSGRAGAVAAGAAAAGYHTNPNDWPVYTPGTSPLPKRGRPGTLGSSERRRRFGEGSSISVSPARHNLPSFPAMNNLNAQPTAANHDMEIGIESRDNRPPRLRRVSYRGGKASGLANDIYRNRPVFGDALVQQQQNRCTALTMKIGKHEKGKVGESIEKMLHNMSGSASVTSQWGGILTSALGKRTSFMTVIRHNLSYDQNNAISYNSTATAGFPSDNMLMPFADDIAIGGGTTMKSAFHVHDDHSVWWTPYNRPDLEDMSWNLNKFKLCSTIKNVTIMDGPVVVGNTVPGSGVQDRSMNIQDATGNFIDFGIGSVNAGILASYLSNIPPTLCTDVAPNRPNYHRRQSELRLNNQRAPGDWLWSSPFPITPIATPPVYQRYKYVRGDTYKYNMVIKSGSLLYNFMNKDPNAAEVTAVVYKVKKSAMMDGVANNISNDELFNRLTKPIGEGYIASILDKMGTEDLGGRDPDDDDITKLPNFPFLPKLRKTKQQALPFTEVMRNTFVMPSGSRRKLKIDLPGEVYDPANIPLCNPSSEGFGPSTGDSIYVKYLPSGSQTAEGTENVGPYYSDDYEFTPKVKYVSVVDEYTYLVVLAVNGVQSSRLFYDPITSTTQGTTEFLAGDTYAAANLQYNCDYTENIQACEYKSKGRCRLWNNALAVMPTTSGGTMEETTTCILPVGQAVRNPASVVTTTFGPVVAGAAGDTNATSATVTNQGAGVNTRN